MNRIHVIICSGFSAVFWDSKYLGELCKIPGQGLLTSYEQTAETGRKRKYYSITKKGRELLFAKEKEWNVFSGAVNKVLQGGSAIVTT